MRRILLPVLLLEIGCGGGDSVSPPSPTSSQPGSPASISVQSGDGQQAGPGASVAIAPSVIVKDGRGHPVAGVTVNFAVDSGGGRVTNSSAVSDVGGIASSGGWTLGLSEGPNVLVASVAGVGSVKLRATTQLPSIVITDASIPPSGGKIAYHKGGDPLDGFELSVPAGAYPQSQRWRVVAYPSLKVELPAGAIQLGGVIEIGNESGYADSMITIRVPARVGFDTALAAFFYDPATHYLEVIPAAARDSVSLTVVTPHFKSGFLWQAPSPAGSPGQVTASALSFGSVRIVLAGIPRPVLDSPMSTDFLPGKDDWEFSNTKNWLRNGMCLGMSVSAMYYFDRIKPTSGKGLFHQYDKVANYDWDNPQGIRFASMIQYIYSTQFGPAVLAEKNKVVALAQQSGVPLDVVSYQTLLVAMWVTKRPQLFVMDRGPGTEGHAVVAYAAGGGVVSLADPNQPGMAGVTARFANKQFAPVNLEPSLGAGTEEYTRIFVLGTSTFIATPLIDSEWARFQGGVAGNGSFMPLYFEWRDNPGDTAYQVLPDSISDWGNYIELRVNCPVCTDSQGVAEGRAIARTGAPFANPNRESTPFRDSVGVAAFVNHEFVDFKWTLVDRRPFDLFGGLPPYLLSKPMSFAALPFGKAPPGVRFVWNFDDHSAPVTVVADSTVSHTFNDPAIHNVTVEMRDASGKKLALATRGFFVESKLVLVALPGLVDSTYRLIARGVLPSPTIKFTWTFGDGSSALVTTDTVVTHRFTKPGNYRVTVKAGNPADFDQDQKFVRIYPGEWRISNLTLIKSVPTKLGWLAGANRAFNDSLTYYLQRLEQNPSDGMLFFADDSLWREHGMYFQIARPGTGGSLVYWGSGSQVWMVARESSVQFSSFSNTGTLWDGSINGVGYVTLFSWPTFTFQGEFQNFISATKTGNTLRGTLRFTLYDGTSSPPERAYTFVAQLVP